jgi:hypothetical protein
MLQFARTLLVVGALLPALAAAQQTFSKEQLEQLVAPIALYPDSLLSQVLMASTYPADVAEAAKWVKANPNQKGDAAVKAVQSQPWDPSVQSLVAFPQVLAMMGEKPDWVQNLGDAFLASSKDVLDAAQRLRQAAQKQGNLKTTEQQKVIVEQEPQTQQQVIKIEPANPQTVYVPTYNPTVVYGTWPYPAYPPYYYPPPAAYYPGAALASGIMFGVGVAATAALWGGCNWGGGDVDINVNKYNNINSNRQISNNKFEHNAANRKGVPYRDQASQQKFGKDVKGADQRSDFRGKDAGRDAQRDKAQASLQDRGMDPAKGRDNLRNDPGTRDRAQAAARDTGQRAGGGPGADRAGGGPGAGGGGVDRGGQSRQAAQARGGGDNAFRGAGDAGQARQQMDRGSSSRQSMAQHGGGGARAGGGGGGGGGGARAGGGGGGGARGGGGGGRGGGGRR